MHNQNTGGEKLTRPARYPVTGHLSCRSSHSKIVIDIALDKTEKIRCFKDRLNSGALRLSPGTMDIDIIRE